MHILAKESSEFNDEIVVFETTELFGEMGKFRCMRFTDEAVQGAIHLKNPERVLLDYQRAVIHLMECSNTSFENVFIIGHGIGTIAGHYPNKRITVAEIDEKVVRMSREFFGYRMNNVVIGDGRDILNNEEPGSYDYIILDAFNQKGTPTQFTTLEFFKITLEKLHSQGVLIMNLMGKAKNDRHINAIHTTLRETYRFTKVYIQLKADAADTGNMIIIGSNKTLEYQLPKLVNFTEIRLEQGHLILDKNEKAPS